MTRILKPAVAIVGGGPSGLRAAAELAGTVDGDVLVLDRESQAGGIPRHCFHPGYGMRDRRSVTTGPRYARGLVAAAEAAGAKILTNATVTGWCDDLGLEVTTPAGRHRVLSQAVVLATGARERPRAARMVPGDRSAGIYTTGQLQNLVHLHGEQVGRRAVVVGAELVSWSAVLTLRGAGCRTTLMTTEQERPDSYVAVSQGGPLLFGTTVATGTRVVAVHGRPRVTHVEIENLRTGARRRFECDTVVFTGDWIPDHELARTAGIDLDAGTAGPAVDAGLRTVRPGVFAIGNLVHPVETADCAALDGRHVADPVRAWLGGSGAWRTGEVPIEPGDGLAWVSPNAVSPGGRPARDRVLAWPTRFVRFPTVEVRQAGQVIGRRRLTWPAAPGRVFRMPAAILDEVRAGAGEVTVGVRS